MKKLTIILVLLMFSTFHVALCQTINCPFDECPGAVWIPQTIQVSTGCPQCTVTVEIMVRCNTCTQPGTVEVLVNKMNVSPECYNICNFTIEEIFTKSYEAAMEKNQIITEPNTPCYLSSGCDDTFISKNITCWKQSVTPWGYELDPCDGVNDCCWYRFVICKVGQWDYQVTAIPEYNLSMSCGNPPPDGCFYVCDWIYDYFNNSNIKNDPNPYHKRSELLNNNSNNCYIVPQPITESAKLFYHSNDNGEIKFVIYDLQGNEVISYIKNKDDKSIIIPFDTKSIPTGTYIYHVYLNNVESYTSKFTIIK